MVFYAFKQPTVFGVDVSFIGKLGANARDFLEKRREGFLLKKQIDIINHIYTHTHTYVYVLFFIYPMELQQAFVFFKNLHDKQIYSDWSPYRPHLMRVGNILQYYLNLFWEWSEEIRTSIIIAWYGHDSIEDTNITKEELEKQFGTYITELIFWMTNEESDLHTDNYVQKVVNSSEEIRLIKLADICDNYQWMIYKANDKEIMAFFKEKIIPIIEPMYQKIIIFNLCLI